MNSTYPYPHITLTKEWNITKAHHSDKIVGVVGTSNLDAFYKKLCKSRVTPTKPLIKNSSIRYITTTSKHRQYIFVDLFPDDLRPSKEMDYHLNLVNEYLRKGNPDILLLFCDYNSLEKELAFFLPFTEQMDQIVLCLYRKKPFLSSSSLLNTSYLEKSLGIPVIQIDDISTESIQKIYKNLEVFIHTPTVFNPIHTLYPQPYENAILQLEPIMNLMALPHTKSRGLSLQLLEHNFTFRLPMSVRFIQLLEEKEQLIDYLTTIELRLQDYRPKDLWAQDISSAYLKRSKELCNHIYELHSPSESKSALQVASLKDKIFRKKTTTISKDYLK